MIGLSAADRILEARDIDIELDRSRCLRSRFRHSDCLECTKVCVNEAITLEDGKITRDRDLCKGCMLCVSNCPSNAFQWEKGWHWHLIGAVKNQPRPLLRCQKALSGDNDVKVPCLGLISEAFIIALFFSIEKPLYVDIAHCEACENRHILSAFEQRLANVAEKLDISLNDRIFLLESESQVKEMQREVGRRKFFGDLKKIIIPLTYGKKAENLAPPSQVFSQKQQPPDSELLLFAMMQCTSEIRNRAFKHYFFSVDVASQCRLCGGCAAMCPTGALKLKKEDHGKQLQFRMFNCNGCNLCQAFCKREAISVRAGIEKTPISSSKMQSELAERSI